MLYRMIVSCLLLLNLVGLAHSRYLRVGNMLKGIQHHPSESNSSYTMADTFYPFLSQDGADPWVFKHPTDGFYYATKSTQINVAIWRSRSLSTLDVAESKIIWMPNNSTACRDVWAPELHLIQHKWYVYFAATTCDGDNANHRMFVLENDHEDPFQGEFRFLGQLTDETDKWAIDGTVFEQPSTKELYYIWSGWEGDVDVMQVSTTETVPVYVVSTIDV
jgi:GH43 family beta-xylosidase